MMYNGANCYSQDYGFLMNQIASKGYLAVVTTEQHPSDVDLPGKPSMQLHTLYVEPVHQATPLPDAGSHALQGLL